MEPKIDSKGNKIPVSYFGDLDSKLKMAQGYCHMFNDMAAKNNQPQIDVGNALKKIVKAHQRFYNEDNKYLGNGSLRNA